MVIGESCYMGHVCSFPLIRGRVQVGVNILGHSRGKMLASPDKTISRAETIPFQNDIEGGDELCNGDIALRSSHDETTVLVGD